MNTFSSSANITLLFLRRSLVAAGAGAEVDDDDADVDDEDAECDVDEDAEAEEVSEAVAFFLKFCTNSSSIVPAFPPLHVFSTGALSFLLPPPFP